jgi:predicted adenylyl cyclase CyaB
MKNLEIKARFENLKKLEKLLQKIGARKTETMHQIDTYFHVPKGRLKLRELAKNSAYLVYYERSDKTTKRFSNYYTYDINDQKKFKELFERVLGVKVTIDKKRLLYMYKNARIHVDIVKNLGTFMEIEVEVKKGNKQAKNLMEEILQHLKIPKSDFIKESYSDLIAL